MKSFGLSTIPCGGAGRVVASTKRKAGQAEFDAPRFAAPPYFWRPTRKAKFRFIDLFAGIGGFRIAMQELGGRCEFSSEWDKFSQITYEANFGEKPAGDITKIHASNIPDHDILCAGFPCQPFSLAGVSKKNSLGREHGFEDETQGTLFFDVKRILSEKRPRAFFLENVKNLLSHDRGRTWATIQRTLQEDLGYIINWRVVDARYWVPQHRERIFIVGFDPEEVNVRAEQINIPQRPGPRWEYPELNQIVEDEVPCRYTLGPGTWATLKRHREYHAARGNGFGYGKISRPIPDGEFTRTISARYHKDGAEILIDCGQGQRPRRLTPREAAQLQGFDPEKFRIVVSDTQAYRQFGNSVAIPAVRSTARMMLRLLGLS